MFYKKCVSEASGLDFRGPGPRFWRVWGSFSRVLDVRNGATNAKTRQKPAQQELDHKWPDRQGWVGGGDPPRGVSIRRPPKVCAACWTTLDNRPQPFVRSHQQRAKLLMASSSSLSGSWTPLFFSPQEPGDHRRPCAKKRKSVALWLFFSIFCPSKLQSKFCIEKTSKKMRKSRLWLPNTLPKLSQNRAFFENVDF